MDNLTIYFIILSAVFFIIALLLAFYIYSIQEKIHIERKILADERKLLAEQVARILNDAADERKDLYDRIQAGTLSQYKEHVEAPNEEVAAEDEEIVSLEDAKDELMNTDG